MAINEKMLALGSKRSIIREIFEYGKKRASEIGEENVFDFSLGNPSVPTPKDVISVIEELTKNNPLSLHGYTSAQGDAETREAVACKIREDFGVKINRDLIYMTCGAAASLAITLKALVEEGAGDEVIVFAPFFTEYRVFIENAGAKVIVSKPDLNSLQIDISDLEKRITPSTKAVILNSPNNPSGVVYSEETISAVCDILTKKSLEFNREIFLISDEPYRELVYTGASVPYLMNYYKNTLVCYSYSKSLSLPGERIGYIAVCPLMREAEKIYAAICGAGRSMGYVCAPSLFQKVIARCVNSCADISIYRKNRDTLYSALCSYGFDCVKPDGAFYLFMRSPEPDAYAFFEEAKKKDILLVPCDDFGISGFVRIAYCVSEERIKAALPAFEALANYYGLKRN